MRALAALLLVGCLEPACPPGDPAEAHPDARFAVVSSDYTSSAIGLLDGDGALLTESWLDSGSVTPRIVAPLSGDVVLPTASIGACRVAVIDRLDTDVVTFLDPCVGGVIAQLDAGAGSNPQDVAAVDGGWLLARYERAFDDVVRVREDAMALGASVSFEPLSDGAALARPTRIVVLEGGVAVVGLARLDPQFGPGAGAVGALDVASGEVTAIELAPFESCDVVVPLPDTPSRALVQCSGRPFETEEGRRSTAGLVLLELDDGEIVERARWAAADHPEEPVYDTSAIALGGTRVLVVAKGDLLLGVHDRVAVLDLATGDATPLFEAGSAFVIGPGALDGDLLLVPDAHEGVIRRFGVGADGVLLERAPIESAPCRGLPPREVRRI